MLFPQVLLSVWVGIMSRGVALLARSLQKMIRGIEKHWCEAVLNTIQIILMKIFIAKKEVEVLQLLQKKATLLERDYSTQQMIQGKKFGMKLHKII